MDFKTINWKKGEEPFLKYLESISEEEYRDFSKNLTPGEFTMLGIRIPILKKVAKEISKGDYTEFLKLDSKNIFEVKLLKGFVISNIKNLDEYKTYFDEFVPLIDNWAICDSFIASSKIIKKDLEYFFKYASSLLRKNDEFLNRVAFVILLDYFCINEYYMRVLKLIEGYKSDAYYANMALAWLLSELYINYTEETKKYIQKVKFDNKVTKYTIRKIKDSFRVSREDKEWLKNIGV